MTIWLPEIDETGPVYLAISRALETDIASGRLTAGDRLPTHRDLAAHLGVNVGTVSRAYAEARRRGLIQGEVGRGTYVRSPSPSALAVRAAAAPSVHGPIDLSVNLPPPEPSVDWGAILRTLADTTAPSRRFGYGDPRGSARLREIAAGWLEGVGVEATPDQVVICAGAQHAILVALASVVGPGEAVVCEPLTYPGFLAAARTLGLRTRPVATDAHGVLPEALETLCRSERPRALYCMPALQNPTATALPGERRARIAELAQRFDLALLCDDIQTGVVDDPFPPFSKWAPEQCLSIVSLSKVLAPGLRVAFLTGGRLDPQRAHEAIWSTVWMASPLGAEIAMRWIETGELDRHLHALKRELSARHAVAADRLDGLPFVTRPGAQHLWLPLPTPWDTSRFATELERRGVRVSPAEVFRADGSSPTPAAVRLSISAPTDHGELARALEAVASLVRGGSAETAPVL